MTKKLVAGYPGLYREDLGTEGTRYRIVISSHKQIFQEYFYFGQKVDEDTALKNAITRWKEIRKLAPIVTRTAFAQIERRKSRSGTVGVRRITSESKGHLYDSWIAVWSDRRHNKKMKSFSINKYGEEEAKKLAFKARAEGLAQMES